MLLEQKSSYITKQNDTWDLISYKVYKSHEYIEVLKDANSDLSKIVIFPPELAIVIPTINISSTGDEPTWFQE
ncbi:tail protein X [uncultured Cetobacterium sp.]|uniref:tail protein X n=1 Tax=uncultured Cetobacterium sp. TaxID=527638 RepID=UPI0026090D08|nr:tail protein X [uncultured Cetobacterium sp.]